MEILGESGLTCLSCDSTHFPSTCRTIGRCQDFEVCAIQSFQSAQGITTYKQSCLNKLHCVSAPANVGRRSGYGTPQCLQCCSTDLCNSGGCGVQGFLANLGHICYGCHEQLGPLGCDEITLCGRDQICHITHLYVQGSDEEIFQTKCIHKAVEVCTDLSSHSLNCSSCCETNLCNNYDTRLCTAMSAASVPR